MHADTDYTRVAYDDGLPVDALPARSPHVVAWSWHNVLCVCTRTSVLLCVTSVRQPAARVIVYDHPLCRHHQPPPPPQHRNARQQRQNTHHRRTSNDDDDDDDTRHAASTSNTTSAAAAVGSVDAVVVGAMWSRGLLREQHYPAESRLCVQTTRHVLVYRVARYGDGCVRVSHGIGIVVGRYDGDMHSDSNANDNNNNDHTTVSSSSDHESSSRSSSSSSEASAFTRRRRRAQRRRRSPSSSSSSSSRSSGHARRRQRRRRTTAAAARTAKTTTRSRRRRRQRDSSSSDSDSSSDGDSETPPRVAARSRRDIGSNNSSTMCHRERYSIVMYAWYDDDVLVIVTDVGVHCVSFCADVSDATRPCVRVLPPPAYRHDGNARTPCCAARVECNDDDNSNDDDTTTTALRARHNLLIVASATLLRVFVIDTTAAAVRLLRCVRMTAPPPSSCVRSLPSCLCALLTTSSSSLRAHTSSNNSHNNDDNAATVTVFVSTPMYTLRGCFALHTATRRDANNNDSNDDDDVTTTTTTAAAAATTTSWSLDAVYDLRSLSGDTALRAFCVAPTHTLGADASAWERLATRPLRVTDDNDDNDNNNNDNNNNSNNNARAATTSRALVLGVSCRCVYGFVADHHHHHAPLLLFRSAALTSATDAPAHSAAAVCGVAVHASCAIAVLLLHTPAPHSPPLLLLPCVASDADGLLYRMLRMNHIVYDDDDDDDDDDGAARGQKRVTSTTRDAAAASVVQPTSSTRDVARRDRDAVLQTLWRRQRRGDLAAWEVVLRDDAHTSALRTYVNAWRRFCTLPRRAQPLLQHAQTTTTTTTTMRTVVAPVLSSAQPRMYVAGHVLRAHYRRLRARYGVELFLRWRNGATRAHASRLLLPPSPPSLTHNNNNDNDDVLCWWQLLYGLRRRCPADVSCVRELVLAHAVVVMARYTHYANTHGDADEHFCTARDACACNAQTLCYDGAVDYVTRYTRAQAACLRHMAATTTQHDADEDVTAAAVVEATVAPGQLLAPWCCSIDWLRALRRFVRECNAHARTLTATSSNDTKSDGGSDDNADSNNDDDDGNIDDDDDAATSTLHTFACSVCDARDVAQLHMSFTHTSTHHTPATDNDNNSSSNSKEAECHTTVFSATTFCPLSLYSSEAVLTRCVDCHMYDFASDALCRVCGGLLQ